MIAVHAACSSSGSTTQDAAPAVDAGSPDSGRHPDAAASDRGFPFDAVDPFPDAMEIDTGFAPDAAEMDALPSPDALEIDAGMPDAMELDGGFAPDAMDLDAGFAPDAADPCAPVPRASGCARLQVAAQAWLSRCMPELTSGESAAFAASLCDRANPAFLDPGLSYDDTQAGLCACGIEAGGCDLFEPALAMPACRAVSPGPLPLDAFCDNSFQCAPGLWCAPNIAALAGVICQNFGICSPLVGPGQACADPIPPPSPNPSPFPANTRCAPGYYCNTLTSTMPTCEAELDLGADCTQIPCRGSNSGFLFPTTECRQAPTPSPTGQPLPPYCAERGRDPSGTCIDNGSCNPLYNCDQNQDCVLRPGLGLPCSLPVDVAVPSPGDIQENLFTAVVACRLPPTVPGGEYCTQTGTTTGRGTCLSVPLVGQPCGIGPGLAPYCAPGSYCAGVDPSNLTTVSSTCAPVLAIGDNCNQDWNDALLGAQCEPGSFCMSGGKSPPMCIGFCLGPPVRVAH